MRPLFPSFLFLFSFAFLLAGCLNPSNGTLTGTITIGPLCPVETNPPQPGCSPTFETYQAHPVKVSRLVTDTQAFVEVTSFTANADGSYQIDLAPGHYRLQAASGINGSITKEVNIQSGQTAVLDLDIDTGIR